MAEEMKSDPMKLAIEQFHEMKRFTLTADAPHLGCAAVFFRGDYKDCQNIQKFIYRMKGKRSRECYLSFSQEYPIVERLPEKLAKKKWPNEELFFNHGSYIPLAIQERIWQLNKMREATLEWKEADDFIRQLEAQASLFGGPNSFPPCKTPWSLCTEDPLSWPTSEEPIYWIAKKGRFQGKVLGYSFFDLENPFTHIEKFKYLKEMGIRDWSELICM